MGKQYFKHIKIKFTNVVKIVQIILISMMIIVIFIANEPQSDKNLDSFFLRTDKI